MDLLTGAGLPLKRIQRALAHIKVKELNKEFRKKVFLAKLEYKNKVERNLSVGNAKDAWKGLNTDGSEPAAETFNFC